MNKGKITYLVFVCYVCLFTCAGISAASPSYLPFKEFIGINAMTKDAGNQHSLSNSSAKQSNAPAESFFRLADRDAGSSAHSHLNLFDSDSISFNYQDFSPVTINSGQEKEFKDHLLHLFPSHYFW